MNVLIVTHREPEPLNLTAFVELATFVLEREQVPPHAEVSIAIVDADEIAQLNERYRARSEPTDVLSFPSDDPAVTIDDGAPIVLGDIVIAPEVAVKNARELQRTVEEELNLLLVHGVLHLMGYDHIDDVDATVMQARERTILAAWAIHV